MERFIDEKELTREMLVAMVARIEITGDRRIEIIYRFADEYKRPLLQFIEESEAEPA
jgi:predicted lipoprotein